MDLYEEKYKKAVQQMKDLLERSRENGWKQILAFEKDFELIFPELKESEDEEIRKWIIKEIKIKHHNLDADNVDFVDKAISWLEKQSEQTTADKVVPKFHEREWLTENHPNNYARFVQILEIVKVQGKNRYRISRDLHNDEDIVECRFIEDNWRPFNTQDAKDGDVLAANECLVLFKEIDGLYIRCYGTYYMGLNPRFDVDTLQYKDAYHPATKEQRDLFFAKMKEAGYKWDGQSKKMLRNDK